MNDTVSFGYEDIAATDKTARVGAVFSSVARKYDMMNDAMSGGMHRLWKDRFVRRVKPRAHEAILDMAGGTGDIAFRLAAAGAEVTVHRDRVAQRDQLLLQRRDRFPLGTTLQHLAHDVHPSFAVLAARAPCAPRDATTI